MKLNKSWYRNLSDLMNFVLLLVGSGGIAFVTVDAAGVKDAAEKVNMNFGSCAGMNPSSYSFVSRIKSDYNILVCENAMKWDATEGTQGNFTYSGGDQVATFCTANGMYMRGHTMVWGAQTPSWVQSLNRTQMLAAMKSHITNLMTHFKGKILEWDIVNEAVADGSSSLKGTFWQKQIGDDFIDSAFVYAHQADPNVYLYYNDYSGEAAGTTKSDYIYNMVKGMLQRGIPIHGVGLQSHLSSPVSKTNISANIKRLGDLGLRVDCTETDIKNSTTDPTSWGNLVSACVENYNATTFMCWGFDDAHSWLGNPCNCQPWDAQDQPKTALVTAIENAFNQGDSTIAAKRKTFISLSPTAILEGKGKQVALNTYSVSRFIITHAGFSFSLPRSGNVKVNVVAMSGKQVAALDLGMQASGAHTIRWDHRQLPVGIYVARVRSGDWSVVNRVEIQ